MKFLDKPYAKNKPFYVRHYAINPQPKTIRLCNLYYLLLFKCRAFGQHTNTCSAMASVDDKILNGCSEKCDNKRSKDLLRNEVITREDHIRSLVQSKGPPKTFQVTSSALAQARSFLPKLAEAEKARLEVGCNNSVNIEAEDAAGDGPFIEMNFAVAGLVSSSDDSSSDSEAELPSGSGSEEEEPTLQVRPKKKAVRRCPANGSSLIKELPGVDTVPRPGGS